MTDPTTEGEEISVSGEAAHSGERWLPSIAPERVCVMIRSLANGGAEHQSVLLARALSTRHETRLVVMSETGAHEKHLQVLRDAEIPVVFLRGPLPRKLVSLISLLREKRPRVLFAHLPGDTALAAVAGRLAGVPFIFGGIRNSVLTRRKRSVLRVLHNYLLSGSIANSFAGRRNMIDAGFDPAKLRVVPNAVELPGPIPPRLETDEVRVLMVGRFVVQKDYETGFRAVASAAERLRPELQLRLTVVGHGPLEDEVREWARAHEIDSVTDFEIDPEHVGALYSEADIYLNSSRFEGLSNSIMEAMAYALPVVATDVGDARALVQEKTGLLCPRGDVEALSGALERLARSAADRAEMGQAGCAHMQAEYSFERFTSRYLSIVEELRG